MLCTAKRTGASRRRKCRKRVEKVSSIERVKTNVAQGDRRPQSVPTATSGIKVDEDYKRYYPYGYHGVHGARLYRVRITREFWGLKSKYDSYLQGTSGKILTLTDARGIEIENAGETRIEPVNGYDLYISMDSNIQQYCEQAAEKAYIKKQADEVSVIVMNPQNGEIMAMVNYPEFNLNEPFTLIEEMGADGTESADKKQELLNRMWRNPCISDTYEPGSTFKIITAAAALEEGVVSLTDQFYCPGYKLVEDQQNPVREDKRTRGRDVRDRHYEQLQSRLH